MSKKLYRIEEGEVFCGVCGGIGDYFNIDHNIIRLLFIIFGFTGTAVVAYIAAALLVPPKSKTF